MARSQITRLVSRSFERAAAMLLVGSLLGWLLGCENEPEKGGLVVVLESDLASPKDIDRIHFEIVQAGTLVSGQDFALGEGETLLPLEVDVPSLGDDKPVTLQGTAYQGDLARIERHAITPIPTDHFALLRMPFHYLCNGSAKRDGSTSCPDGLTCKHGSCADASLDPSELTRLDRGETATRGSPILGADDGAGAGTCFDVLACFASAVVVELDVGTCSFPVDEAVPREALNVALALPPGGDGICDTEGCWVALSPGENGWLFDHGRVQLPESLCTPLPDAGPPAVAVSLACASKPAVIPPCGPWSSQQEPIPLLPASVLPPDAIGDACSGRATRPCGQCGVSQRMCRNGNWQAWSECQDEGVCEPASTQDCGAGGSQLCGDRCQWNECSGQSCSGPSSEACGNCGTRSRECVNGSWADWTACAGEGACAPDQVQACGAGGNHACIGSCQWGPCTDQSCPGAPTRACAMCGTQSRECNEDSGDWSEFGACDGQGACEPGSTQACGNDGTRTCGGDCQWGELCSGQTCRGATMETCGNCGVRTRGCDRNSGVPTDWSACTDQGACQAGTRMSCGNGSRTCSDRCEWSECSGCADGLVNCAGACVPVSSSAANCGGCGRACGADQSCQSGQCVCDQGLLTCGDACVAASSDEAHCGDCDTRCGSGQVCQRGDCVCRGGAEDVQGVCLPACASGEQRCGNDCVNTADDEAHCGQCGIRCGRGETCERGSCLAMPVRFCAGLCGNDCVDLETDRTHCGDCDTACGAAQDCVEGTCQDVCRSPLLLCGDDCTDLSSDARHCGECDHACDDGVSCQGGACGDIGCEGGLRACKDECFDLENDRSHCGECDHACGDGESCEKGRCAGACRDQGTRCDGRCVELLRDLANCGKCGNACESGELCLDGSCRKG